MNITQDNYEQYFLDHAEGILSPEMERELSDFLEANPGLKAVLDDFDPSPLQTVSVHNDKLKARLKKHLLFTNHINEDNVDEWMIRDIEGLLDESEENELQEFLSLNPAYHFDYKIFGYTKLSPDLAVTYRRKKELKKQVTHFPMRRLVWVISGIAALLILFIGIRYFSQQETEVKQPAAPAIAVIPLVSSPGNVADTRTSPVDEKKIREKIKRAPETRSGTGRVNVYHSQPIPAQEIILFDPTSTASIKLNNFDYSPVLKADEKDRSLISKVFGNLVVQAREGLGNRPKMEKVSKSDFSFWSVAKAGINGFNNMSDRDLELYLRKDEAGKVKSYALVEEERLILSKDLNKN